MNSSLGFEPQLSKKGTPPPPLPITIEFLIVDPATLSATEVQRVRDISSDPGSRATLPPGPFVATLKGNFRTLGEVRRAIGAARGCDPDIVGLATDDGPLLEEDSQPPVRLAMVADSSRQDRERASAERVLKGLQLADHMQLATLAHGFSKMSPEELCRPPSPMSPGVEVHGEEPQPPADESQRRSSAQGQPDVNGSDVQLNLLSPQPPPPTTTTGRPTLPGGRVQQRAWQPQATEEPDAPAEPDTPRAASHAESERCEEGRAAEHDLFPAG